MAYNHSVTLRSLQNDALFLVQNDSDLSFWLDYVALPDKERKDITGIVVLINDGDLCAMWLTEYSAWYDLGAIYHPLPWYNQYDEHYYCPDYHKESCECYDLDKLQSIIAQINR